MRTVLCFGDSNTWGSSADDYSRYDWNTRWTGVLQRELGATFRVLEEGLPGRTTSFDDPDSPDRNGARALPMLLETHSPLDLIVIMLGTNDLKKRIGTSTEKIADGIRTLISLCKNPEYSIQKILILSPPHLVYTTNLEIQECFPDGIARSKELAPAYKKICEEEAVLFFDAQSVVATSAIDGVHWESSEHEKLGTALSKIISGI